MLEGCPLSQHPFGTGFTRESGFELSLPAGQLVGFAVTPSCARNAHQLCTAQVCCGVPVAHATGCAMSW